MATRKQPKLQVQGTDQVRRAYAQAVLAGIYASFGAQILNMDNHTYTQTLANVRRVAFEQADEMLKEPA